MTRHEGEEKDTPLQWLAEGCCGGTRSLALQRGQGFCSRVAGGTVGYIQAKHSARGTRREERKRTRRQKIRCKTRKKYNVAESGRERERGEAWRGEARRGEEEEEVEEEEEEKERAKAERDREFGRARVFLNVVCART